MYRYVYMYVRTCMYVHACMYMYVNTRTGMHMNVCGCVRTSMKVYKHKLHRVSLRRIRQLSNFRPLEPGEGGVVAS